MTSQHSPGSSIDQSSLDGVLASAGPASPTPPLPQRPRPLSIHRSPNLETVHEPETKEPFSPNAHTGRSRPLSFSARNGNRLSLSFPVQPHLNPPSADSTITSFPSTPAEPLSGVLSPTDPGTFLTALASQERKVLELRDELRRAEMELDRLKRHWERQQGQRRIGENIIHESLSHLQNGSPNEVSGSESDDTVRRTLELDRRKALLEGLPVESRPRRKIIRGGHTRTLSLLSPDKLQGPGLPSIASTTLGTSELPARPDGLTRSSTVSEVRRGSGNMSANPNRHSYQNGVGMKQLAEGFKTGLYNFMEDLRQATVGDEAINGVSGGLRPPQDASSKRVVKKVSRGSLSRKERSRSPNTQSHSTPNNKTKDKAEPRKKTVSKPVVAELDDDDWDNWESPSTKVGAQGQDQSAADDNSLITTDRSQLSSPAADLADSALSALDSAAQRAEISWSSLNGLNLPSSITPTRIKKTAEAFMREWEKSLSPDPEPDHERPSTTSRSNSFESRADAQLIEGL